MANTSVFFSDLKSGGKCSSVVEARLLRYWEAWNVKRGSDLMWVDMLLIDVNVSSFFFFAVLYILASILCLNFVSVLYQFGAVNHNASHHLC